MNVPILRMVNAAYEDAATGINAQLAGLTMDGTDTVPEDIVACLAAPDDDLAAHPARKPMDWPVVISSILTPAAMQHKSVTGRAYDAPSLLVTSAVLSRDTAEPAQAWRDADYYLKAMVRSLLAGLFAATPAAAAARRRGSVTLVKLNSLTWEAAYVRTDAGLITGLVTLDCYASDSGA